MIFGAIAFVLLGTLTACGGGDDDGADESGPSPDCRLLNAKDRLALAGVVTDEEAPVGMKTAGKQCRWIASKSRVIIETTTAESPEWAEKVPGVIDQMESSGLLSDEDLREIAESRKILDGPEPVDPVEACELFTTLAEIGGAPSESDMIVNYLPFGTDRMAITAQTCTSGRFTSISLAKPKIAESAQIEDAMRKALETAHQRALATSKK